MLERIAAVIAAAPGGEMEFSEFVSAAQQTGLRPELWLKAKHAGLISARIDADGRHILSVNTQAAQVTAADEGAEA